MRITRGQTKRKKHNKILKAAKGYAYAKSHRYRNAKNQIEKSMQYATRDNKRKKREIRKFWITRVNAACRLYGIKYSRFISGLKKASIELDRKSLHELVINDIDAFKELVTIVQSNTE